MTYLDKLPAGSTGDCRHCDDALTKAPEHPELGALWLHDKSRSVWCDGRDPENNHVGEPKF